MSRKNNVNPDHYKTGGRDRPNEDLPPHTPRPAGSGAAPLPGRGKRRPPAPNFIPGAAPVGETTPEDDDETAPA